MAVVMSFSTTQPPTEAEIATMKEVIATEAGVTVEDVVIEVETVTKPDGSTSSVITTTVSVPESTTADEAR